MFADVGAEVLEEFASHGGGWQGDYHRGHGMRIYKRSSTSTRARLPLMVCEHCHETIPRGHNRVKFHAECRLYVLQYGHTW